jgi:AraC-like DNA-binding protein
VGVKKAGGDKAVARVDPRNRTRYWNDAHVVGLSCLCADFTDHEYAPHSHDALVVAVTEAGGSEFRSRGEVREATASALLVFNPAEPHSGRMARSKRWLYRGLYLTAPALETVAGTLGIDTVPYFTTNVFADADLIAAFESLHRALQQGTDALLEREKLVASFGGLFRRHGASGKKIPVVNRNDHAVATLKALMGERYAEPIMLEEMGRVVDLTPFQLIGLFKRTVGLTPHAYLTQVRLKAAIREMRRGTSIAQAALAAGFYDQSALTTHFKRAYGITPLQWVRATADRSSDARRNFGQ